MPIGKNTIIKLMALATVLLIWSVAMLWVGANSSSVLETKLNRQPPPAQPSAFYPLDRFIFSVPGQDTSHYLLLEMAIKSGSRNADDAINDADPLIRNTMMKMFSNKQFEQLQNNQQMEQLQSEALLLVSEALSDNHFDIAIDDILFTRMVMQ